MSTKTVNVKLTFTFDDDNCVVNQNGYKDIIPMSLLLKSSEDFQDQDSYETADGSMEWQSRTGQWMFTDNDENTTYVSNYIVDMACRLLNESL